MDINKIKERLAALRPEDLDAEDPEIGELLMLVEEDLELAEWFAQEQVFDRAFSEKLQSIKPPAGLDERILAAMEKASATELAPVPQPESEVEAIEPAMLETEEEFDDFDIQTADELTELPIEEMAEKPVEAEPEATPDVAASEKVVPISKAESTEDKSDVGTAVPFDPQPKRSWWRNPGVLSAAAAAVLLIAITMFSLSPTPVQAKDLDGFYSSISEHHKSQASLTLQTDSLDVIRDYLGQQGAPVPGKLPANIDPYPEIGCSIMHWGSEVVSVIRMDDAEQVDVYIVRQGLFPDFEDRIQPQLVELDQVVVLGWSDGNMHYFLVRTGDLSKIDSLL